MTNKEVLNKIDDLVKNNDVVLFMKGSSEMPLCGFSARVASILSHLKLNYLDVNILQDNDLRQGIKDYSDWPTIPQLYVKGSFIGGCDIVKDMFEKGELQKLLTDKQLIS